MSAKRKRQRGTTQRERDIATLRETVGFLRGLCVMHNDDDYMFRWAEPLAARLNDLERRLFPLDPQ